LFAVTAAFLAAVALYGVVSHVVVQRTRYICMSATWQSRDVLRHASRDRFDPRAVSWRPAQRLVARDIRASSASASAMYILS
jgi:hypothetical protein